jgi:hypothetical protein
MLRGKQIVRFSVYNVARVLYARREGDPSRCHDLTEPTGLAVQFETARLPHQLLFAA